MKLRSRLMNSQRIVKFGLVGATGVLVNSAVLYAGHTLLGLPLLLASAIAVEVAVVNNFTLNNLWTFGQRSFKFGRLVQFNLVSLGGMAITTGVLVGLVNLYAIHYLIANLIAIGLATTWNYVLNSLWTWRSAPSKAER